MNKIYVSKNMYSLKTFRRRSFPTRKLILPIIQTPHECTARGRERRQERGGREGKEGRRQGKEMREEGKEGGDI